MKPFKLTKYFFNKSRPSVLFFTASISLFFIFLSLLFVSDSSYERFFYTVSKDASTICIDYELNNYFSYDFYKNNNFSKIDNSNQISSIETMLCVTQNDKFESFYLSKSISNLHWEDGFIINAAPFFYDGDYALLDSSKKEKLSIVNGESNSSNYFEYVLDISSLEMNYSFFGEEVLLKRENTSEVIFSGTSLNGTLISINVSSENPGAVFKHNGRTSYADCSIAYKDDSVFKIEIYNFGILLPKKIANEICEFNSIQINDLIHELIYFYYDGSYGHGFYSYVLGVYDETFQNGILTLFSNSSILFTNGLMRSKFKNGDYVAVCGKNVAQNAYLLNQLVNISKYEGGEISVFAKRFFEHEVTPILKQYQSNERITFWIGLPFLIIFAFIYFSLSVIFINRYHSKLPFLIIYVSLPLLLSVPFFVIYALIKSGLLYELIIFDALIILTLVLFALKENCYEKNRC